VEGLNMNETKQSCGYAEGAANNQLKDRGMLMGGTVGGMAAEGRQSAKGVLRDRIRMLRHEADQLEALAQSLPEVLPRDADAALWSLAIRARN
jgi:hypothetical protein